MFSFASLASRCFLGVDEPPSFVTDEPPSFVTGFVVGLEVVLRVLCPNLMPLNIGWQWCGGGLRFGSSPASYHRFCRKVSSLPKSRTLSGDGVVVAVGLDLTPRRCWLRLLW
ncbi:hypothetical protein HanHA300_Chr01g0013041 [Helianthus annuus]|nr:hypothetical protein HanHA300_Chr01g0013041 [Helianthus annuus]KAJ0626527.1 hypothetical protein HanHA89_Chr01g0014181 [Helianthus annuus]KAJ0815680.1 hypothetical protein HanLR1_Chr00c0665g0766761 [Helianthus annuus]